MNEEDVVGDTSEQMGVADSYVVQQEGHNGLDFYTSSPQENWPLGGRINLFRDNGSYAIHFEFYDRDRGTTVYMNPDSGEVRQDGEDVSDSFIRGILGKSVSQKDIDLPEEFLEILSKSKADCLPDYCLKDEFEYLREHTEDVAHLGAVEHEYGSLSELAKEGMTEFSRDDRCIGRRGNAIASEIFEILKRGLGDGQNESHGICHEVEHRNGIIIVDEYEQEMVQRLLESGILKDGKA